MAKRINLWVNNKYVGSAGTTGELKSFTHEGAGIKIEIRLDEDLYCSPPAMVKRSYLMEVPENFPTTPHLSRVVAEGDTEFCTACGSGWLTKFLWFGENGCRQPKCKNYYKKKNENNI